MFEKTMLFPRELNYFFRFFVPPPRHVFRFWKPRFIDGIGAPKCSDRYSRHGPWSMGYPTGLAMTCSLLVAHAWFPKVDAVSPWSVGAMS